MKNIYDYGQYDSMKFTSMKKRPSNNSMFLGESVKGPFDRKPLQMQPIMDNDYVNF